MALPHKLALQGWLPRFHPKFAQPLPQHAATSDMHDSKQSLHVRESQETPQPLHDRKMTIHSVIFRISSSNRLCLQDI